MARVKEDCLQTTSHHSLPTATCSPSYELQMGSCPAEPGGVSAYVGTVFLFSQVFSSFAFSSSTHQDSLQTTPEPSLRHYAIQRLKLPPASEARRAVGVLRQARVQAWVTTPWLADCSTAMR